MQALKNYGKHAMKSTKDNIVYTFLLVASFLML